MCKNSLDETKTVKIEKRQVFDLPEIKINITEYQTHTKICPKCKKVNKPSFPEGINAQTQYGDNLKSFVSYCNTYQIMPSDFAHKRNESTTLKG